MLRYTLKIWFHETNNPDIKVDLKNKQEVRQWIDASIFKAILIDNVNKKEVILMIFNKENHGRLDG